MLELVGEPADATLVAEWRARVGRARSHLGWEEGAAAVRPHDDGISFAVAAPVDQLYTATEANEWALCSALTARDPGRAAPLEAALAEAALAQPGPLAAAGPPAIDEAAALARLGRAAGLERQPALVALVAASTARALPWLLDDDEFSIGAGAGCLRWPLDALPAAAGVPWRELRDVPTVLVTGSNGKTTTVRLVAACLRAAGLRPGYSCTDGLFVDGEWIARGDYSGPVGARTVLREPRVEAAVLETARGGILRRGLAVSRVAAAVVTNVSADHFGEYGIHDLDALADVKLTVAAAIAGDGLLVLNADDPTLRAKSAGLGARFGRSLRIGWFAHAADDPFLAAQRATEGATCGVRDGRVLLHCDAAEHDLGPVAGMPLTVAGRAGYNVANLCAAALAAASLGVAPALVADVLARFGARPEDNPGRLMRFERDGVQVIVDYAHNPEGLRGLLEVAEGLRAGRGRLGLVLGHAGNRVDADIERLAAIAAAYRPALVIVKELEGYLRGRAPGEVPRILRETLLRHGLPAEALTQRPTELDAVHGALGWARPGDVLVLPVHGLEARAAVLALLRSDDR